MDFGNLFDYQYLWNDGDDSECYCSCGGQFYKLGDWCICDECGSKIPIDEIGDYMDHSFFIESDDDENDEEE